MSSREFIPFPADCSCICSRSCDEAHGRADPHLSIGDQILTSLAKRLKCDVNQIQPSLSLRDDLGLDSADAIELIFDLEEMFDIEVSDQDFRAFITVSEVIQYVQRRLQKL